MKRTICSTNRMPFFPFIVSIAIMVMFHLYYLCISQPYYVNWDMDQIVTMDSFAVNSDAFPDHINHTSFGLYFILGGLQKFFYKLGLLSGISVQDLASAQDPQALVAEITDFNRLLSPIFIAMILFFVGWSLVHLNLFGTVNKQLASSNQKCIFSALLICFLGTLPFPQFHAATVRSELFSILFWSFGFCIMAKLKYADNYKHSQRLVLALGLFLAASFVTKIQGFFYVAILIFWGFILFDKWVTENSLFFSGRFTSSGHNKEIVLSFFNICLFGYFVFLAYSFQEDLRAAAFATSYEFNTLGKLFLVGLVYLLAASVYIRRVFTPFIVQTWNFKIANSIWYGNRLVFGMWGVILLHVFTYFNWQLGINYFILDFKMVFVRLSDIAMRNLDTAGVVDRYYYFLAATENNKVLFEVNLILFALIVCLFIFGKRKDLYLAFSTLVVNLGNFLNLFWAVRPFNGAAHDTIWFDILQAITFFYNIGTIYNFLSDKSRFIKQSFAAVSITTMIFLIWVNLGNNFRLYRNSAYYYDREKYFTEIYHGSQQLAGAILNQAYPTAESRNLALSKNNRFRQIKFWVNNIFANRIINSGEIGILAQNQEIKFNNSPGEIVTEFSGFLKNPLVVVPQKNEHLSWIYKIYNFVYPKMHFGLEQISIRKRKDLTTYLFLPNDIHPDLKGWIKNEKFVVKSKAKDRATRDMTTKEYVGYVLDDENIVNMSDLGNRYFFVLDEMI